MSEAKLLTAPHSDLVSIARASRGRVQPLGPVQPRVDTHKVEAEAATLSSAVSGTQCSDMSTLLTSTSQYTGKTRELALL